jgi:hypothetical protein
MYILIHQIGLIFSINRCALLHVSRTHLSLDKVGDRSGIDVITQ